jgi:DNA-binding response OmpR family regulator
MAELNGLRVLLIEDEWRIAAAIEDVLHDLGCEVVGTVEKAQESVARDRFDVALLDLNLHGEMAYSVADTLIAQGKALILLTAYETQLMPDRLRSYPQCQKPCPPNRMAELLSRVVRKSEAKQGSTGASSAKF